MTRTECTPLPIIALVSRVVTRVVDRITGDRSDFPLLVAAAGVEALRNLGIESRIMYGQAAWIEVLEDHSIAWVGCWNGNLHFWVATQFGEIVDLNTSVAHRKPAHANPRMNAIYSPPLLWSAEVPLFYRYVPEGIAELELTEARDRRWHEVILSEVREKCVPAGLPKDESAPEFPNEPILCAGRRVLDDSHETFRLFDRALSVAGIPKAPF